MDTFPIQQLGHNQLRLAKLHPVSSSCTNHRCRSTFHPRKGLPSLFPNSQAGRDERSASSSWFAVSLSILRMRTWRYTSTSVAARPIATTRSLHSYGDVHGVTRRRSPLAMVIRPRTSSSSEPNSGFRWHECTCRPTRNETVREHVEDLGNVMHPSSVVHVRVSSRILDLGKRKSDARSTRYEVHENEQTKTGRDCRGASKIRKGMGTNVGTPSEPCNMFGLRWIDEDLRDA